MSRSTGRKLQNALRFIFETVAQHFKGILKGIKNE